MYIYVIRSGFVLGDTAVAEQRYGRRRAILRHLGLLASRAAVVNNKDRKIVSLKYH